MPPSPKPVTSIGLIGFGAFGRLVARHLAPHVPLRIFDPALDEDDPDFGESAVPSDLAGAAGADLVILAVPVAAMGEAARAIRPYLEPGATVLDVGSVKAVPAAILSAELPEHVDIVGTHPLFGPESARDGIAGHRIAVCSVRGRSAPRIAAFLRRVLRLRVIMTTPAEHDREAAVVQGLTHLIAKVLIRMEPLPGRMTTASFEHLMRATDMVRHDSPGVFEAIEKQNPYAADVRERFFALAGDLKTELDGAAAAPRPVSEWPKSA